MPGPFSPNDSLIGPIVHQLALFIQAQIPSIAYLYEKLPAKPPQDNSFIIPLLKSKITNETSGKIYLMLTFAVQHIFRRKELDANIASAYSYIVPWLSLLAAWPNQNLGGLTRSVSAKDLLLSQAAASGQAVVALTFHVEIETEFNIPLT